MLPPRYICPRAQSSPRYSTRDPWALPSLASREASDARRFQYQRVFTPPDFDLLTFEVKLFRNSDRLAVAALEYFGGFHGRNARETL